MSFDMNALMKQAQEMQAQMKQLQEEAAKETAEASAGGGMVTVVASAGGEIKELRIDPKAIDPDDPEMLADRVMTAAYEALRSAHAKVEAKMKAMLREALYEVTGRKLAVDFALGERAHEHADDDAPTTEEDVVELMKSTFDARELDE